MSGDLQRFVDAQAEPFGRVQVYDQALAELRAGKKDTHWIWYVFPQVRGLGKSTKSQRFGIRGLDEARAYLAHPVLGPRLIESARALTELESDDPEEVMGPDAMKLKSSMTLFTLAAPDEPVFRQVLEQYFDGELDGETQRRV